MRHRGLPLTRLRPTPRPPGSSNVSGLLPSDPLRQALGVIDKFFERTAEHERRGVNRIEALRLARMETYGP